MAATNDLDNFDKLSLEEGDNSYSDNFLEQPAKLSYRPSPKRLLPPLKPIDFEKYIKDNCEGKIKILNRTIFQQINRPILIFFNHFREKCAYHTKCLDTFYQLALKYGERIEFIAADMLDIDVMNLKWHPIEKFCSILSPEKVTATIYAIDEMKRVYEHATSEKNSEVLLELCENLLRGTLFLSQTLPERDECSLVKICTHYNYHDLVTNSKKYVLLIVDSEDYSELNLKYEPDYETIVKQLLQYNIDVIYINAKKNYIPFEFGISSYPSLLLIPPDDKTNFMDPLIGPYTEENIVKCMERCLKDPKTFLQQKQIDMKKKTYQPIDIMANFKIAFENLTQYLQDQCQHYLKVFERKAFLRSNHYIIIAFMDFIDSECTAEHLKWIDKIYQVARNLASPREYLIADFKDIDVINPLWKSEDFKKNTEIVAPKIFGINLNRNKFVLKDFKSAASLFYFAYSLTNGELYISEPWPKINDCELVKTCIADGLNLSISSAKMDIFLAIYYSNTKDTEKFLQLLENVAMEMKRYSVKIMKIDSRLNCIPLEWDNSMYPIMYFIPQTDKNKKVIYPSDGYISKESIVEFIIKNIN